MTSTEPLRLQHTFGSIERTGAWEVPSVVRIKQRMGSVQLDFTGATLESAETLLDIDMIGGSIELTVPAGMAVDADLQKILASYQDHRTESGSATSGQLTLRGRAIWGSVEVRG